MVSEMVGAEAVLPRDMIFEVKIFGIRRTGGGHRGRDTLR